MLELALRAALPLVSVHTRDTANVGRVLHHYCPGIESVQGLNATALGQAFSRDGGRYWWRSGGDVDGTTFDAWHREIVEAGAGASVVVVNHPRPHPALFDAGELVVPDDLMLSAATAWHSDEVAARVMPALRGLTLMEAYRALSLAAAEDPDVSVASVARMRRAVFGMPRGLEVVEASTAHYRPHREVDAWAEEAAALARVSGLPAPLRPRGMALSGPPGVGKTTAAKHAAERLGVPIYRLAVGASLSKWLGESERNLSEALAAADRLAPCVLLIDECEKLFRGDEDGGAPKRMLADLLWWMQERTSTTIVVLTTNDLAALPPELVRPGRVDRLVELEPLTGADAVAEFVAAEYEALGLAADKAAELRDEVMDPWAVDGPVSQAEAAQRARAHARRRIASGGVA